MNSKSRIEKKLTIENYKQHLENWKRPYLQRVSEATYDFRMKVLQAEKKTSLIEPTKKNSVSENRILSDSEESEANVQGQMQAFQKSSNKEKNRVFNQLPSQVITLQQWKPNTSYAFKDHQEILKSYSNIFQKKQKLKKLHNEKISDFRIDQWEKVNELYQQLKNQGQQDVNFTVIIEFFENCELFYYFYNISPYRLPNLLRESANKYKDRLTKEEFFNFFLIDRPTMSDYNFKTQRNVQNLCIFSLDNWKKLKSLFDTLDTFGNQEINIKNLFQKLKSNPSNSFLLSEVVNFPEIGRTYNLEKVIFDLENKYKFNEKVQWSQIEDLLSNFTHIDDPTFDQICANKISKTQITNNTNYFLLEPKIVQSIKDIFNLCPRYCKSFVKSSLFTLELLESSQIKKYLSHPVRLVNYKTKQYLLLQNVIKSLNQEAPEYFDLDEMLEHFSIKGVYKPIQSYFDNFSDEESSDEDLSIERERNKIKKIKSLQNLKKNAKNKLVKTLKNENTKPKEFNLHKRDTLTIREKKVQEMIKQKQMIEEIQLSKQFKANSIPATINPERYQKYVKQMRKKKQSILNRLSLKREKDSMTIEYLKSNTKLFEIKKKKVYEKQQYKFEPKPVPINNSQQLLSKIQEEKIAQRKLRLQATKNEYLQKHWINLNTHEKKHIQDISLIEEIQMLEGKPDIKNKRKNHQVPDFEVLHRNFAQELERRKMKIEPTKIEQFNLTSPKKSQFLPRQQQSSKRIVNSKSPPMSPSAANIRTTKKYEDWISYNQNREAQKQIQLFQKERQKQERLTKQRNFAKYMRKNLANCTNIPLKDRNAEKLKHYKNYVHNLQRETEQQLAEIYGRVLQRPFLFEQASSPKGQDMMESQDHTTKQGDIPKKVIQQQSNQAYDYGHNLFEKQSEQFHPIASEDLNLSF